MTFNTPALSGSNTDGSNPVSGVDPVGAQIQLENDYSTLENQIKAFDKMAKTNAWMAIQYFMLSVGQSILTYQGDEMNMQSAFMDTVSLLNGDLNQVNSDLNNIFQILQEIGTATPTSSQTDELNQDIQDFMNDGTQFVADFDEYFVYPVNKGEPLFDSDLSSTQIENNFKGWGQITDSSSTTTDDLFDLFSSVAQGSTMDQYGNTIDWDDVGSSLSTLFTNAYNSEGGETEKQDFDVVTNTETLLNQQSSAASTALTADQQNFNSYQSTLNDILTQMAKLFQGIVQQIGASTSS